jgi:hypothetical protein
MKQTSVGRQNFEKEQASRARKMRAAAKKPPTPAQVEAALALIQPLPTNPYKRLLAKLDLGKLQREGQNQPPESEP